MDHLTLRPGGPADYPALARFHYLANAPATMTRVLVIEDESPTIHDRWRALQIARGEPAEGLGPRDAAMNDRTSKSTRIVAVLVESLPALSCALRDIALPGRYTGFDRRSAARLLNDELRCISRVIVHPRFRGLGLAVRLVRHALSTAATAYTEALAAMGRVHPFFKQAGMTEYQRPPLSKDQRLLDAMRSVGVEPWELASRRRMADRLGGGSMTSPTDAALLRDELARWAGRRLTLDEQLDRARRKLLTQPRYYLHARPG